MESAATESLKPPLDHMTSVRAEQTRVVFKNAPLGTTGAILAAILLGAAVLVTDQQLTPVVFRWLTILIAIFLAHNALCFAYGRARDPVGDWRLWAGWFVLAALAEGVTWGVGSVSMMTSGELDRELVIMTVVAVVASSSATVFGPLTPAFLAFMLPTMSPYLFYTLLEGDRLHLVLGLLDTLFLFAVAAIGWRSTKVLQEILELRFENAELITDLRAQKSRAEEASTAKSRFLASASHDLRQPVHALGMFVGALQNRDMDDEARRILGHVDRSIESLESLFSALLDISKLDAGVVETRPAVFPVQPMLERIAADHRALAEAKDIRFTLVPCSLAVHTDPILLERIIRNIVLNAVRFTDSGGVLIGCRRGRELRIEVLDTGPGIPEGERQRIFSEFYQLQNPERDRAKGLGLGLAIVGRLADLIGCKVTLRSVPGKGSNFAIALPVVFQPVEFASSALVAAPTVKRGLVLVVDDEAMIQQAMATLLSSWGFDVIVTGSYDDMLAEIETCYVVPSLIISDLRLRNQESGIDVIRNLQAQYNDDIPGLLITGDTAPDRIRESADSGLQMLHKPITPMRLRASIEALLAEPAAHVE